MHHRRPVLIVGFSPLTRIGLARVVARLPEVGPVSAAASPAAAARFAARNPTGLAVVDQAEDPGFTLVKALSSGYSPCPVVVLLTPSGHADEDARFAFAQGARAVALATASATALHQVLAGVYLGVPTQSKRETSPEQKRSHALSQRETEILALIADGMSSKSIAERLVVSVETVRSHCKNIIRKLEANGRAEAVSIAYRTGILDSDALPLA
jgi:DNA-binding NarL/FixJ family response regulator